jgi:hypothetical protein
VVQARLSVQPLAGVSSALAEPRRVVVSQFAKDQIKLVWAAR